MSDNLVPLKRALVSVTDKTGLVECLKGLRSVIPDIEIIASGGTAKTLENAQILYTPLSVYTGFPEIFDGRVKTLHPKIAGGILQRQGKDEKEGKSLGILPVDLVICNLYDFSAKANEAEEMSDLVESIDIGGPTLIRSSGKNYQSVTLVTASQDYSSLIEEVKQHRGKTSLSYREKQAVKGFNLSADYEAAIAQEMTRRLEGAESLRPHLNHGKKLRYGENPDQEGWLYTFQNRQGVAQGEQLSGKPPSFNNYEDATSAYHAAIESASLKPNQCFSIVKHGGLCGYATGSSAAETFSRAWEGDAVSAFGSVVGSYSQVEEELIPVLEKKFVEVIIAPGFSPVFISWAKEKRPKLRLIKAPSKVDSPLIHKNVSGGLLVQTEKTALSKKTVSSLFKRSSTNEKPHRGIVTKTAPEPDRQDLYAFGISAVKFIKSNAIAIVWEYEKGCYQLIGVGGGQPNRIDSLQKLAIPKAIDNLKKYGKSDFSECVFVSDGFFPFEDGVRAAAEAGLLEGVQPGGSIRDREVIEAADACGMKMIFTGERYFTH